MWNRLKEQSSLTGVGIAGLTYLQMTGDWKGALFAAIAAALKIALPEAK